MTINTNPYCEVSLPGRDSVLRGPQKLSQNYKAQDGSWKMNIWEDGSWTDSSRINVGLYPYVENDAGSPGRYWDRSLTDFTIHPDQVSRDAVYIQWTIDQIKDSKYREMELQLTAYSSNENNINPKIAEYVRNDAEWLALEQAKLARITDWQEAADFDTTKPNVLILPNSFVGESYVRQGRRLTSENQASIAAQQGEIWDQAEINSFVSANRNAANDSSNSTVPQKPSFRLRQAIANVSEQFNRIVIWREFNPNSNPVLQTTYKMQMRNRQDNRNLYVFSYTNSTYLTWRQFLDQGNGVWALEATPAEWQYVPLDMGFIFSYGTNPAVETDFFTDRVEFPAGVEEQNLLVAWDPV